jgi:hypothetical protein
MVRFLTLDDIGWLDSNANFLLRVEQAKRQIKKSEWEKGLNEVLISKA